VQRRDLLKMAAVAEGLGESTEPAKKAGAQAARATRGMELANVAVVGG
jgi:hypothetical protein